MILLGGILLPVCLSKVVNEFKGMAYFMTAAIMLFTMFFVTQMYDAGLFNEGAPIST